MSARTRLIVAVVLSAVVIAGLLHLAFWSEWRVTAEATTTDTGTSTKEWRVQLLGDKCLEAEDMTRLRLVSYRPIDHVAVYRCLVP